MKLTVIGGGGFRVPQIFQALSAADARLRVDELWLYDVSAERLDVVGSVLAQLAPSLARPPQVRTTTTLTDALANADFVFSAIRIGGTAGRITDERTALRLGVLGQETVGPGGLAYALRTVPHALRLAEEIATHAPDAWTINFTNPAGIITEAMRRVLGERVVSICDTPIGLMRRAARVVGQDPRQVDFDYVGLNHLGWLRTLVVDGRDVLPELLASDERLDGMEEARLLGFDWVRAIGAIPNEYLFYYYRHREAMERITGGQPTRGEFLDVQQGAFYREAAAAPDRALEIWDATRHDRESSYMNESRPEEERHGRRAEDVEGGGYQEVALDLMTGLATGEAATMILGVGNDSLGGDRLLVPQLDGAAVLEVPCTVERGAVRPHPVAPLDGEMAGLITTVKASEQLVLRALDEGSRELAWRAFANHPLVDSTEVARQLVEDYCAAMPDVAARLR
ncbi:6-phospho-beta-glucosidase [Georgenia satyanarayanai]|uniref:6-phospho-beta-glucosidase n=1 Tax=Georgenia satyanarayanai TaxID=860221 RepID=A0A2Y9AFW6_9MICO|nr:6-phospho-beta-glucosidase [Georgenia satyanarayanai]PYF99236.1 6-phospho-beta-glucosidase [Georgenia satyanarayanai]SSA43354.1 6-phospho-beta-glucosidase [Georgenia satyanarayanai]